MIRERVGVHVLETLRYVDLALWEEQHHRLARAVQLFTQRLARGHTGLGGPCVETARQTGARVDVTEE